MREHLLSIKKKLFLLIAAIIIPILMVEAFIYYQRFERRRNEELQANTEIAHSVAGTFSLFIKDILHEELAVGISITRSNLSKDEVHEILHENQAEYPALSYTHWIDSRGFIANSTETGEIGESRQDRSYFKEIVAGKPWVMTELYVSRVTGKSVFAIARGIRNQRDELLGIMVSAVSPAKMDAALAFKRLPGRSILVIDKYGYGVYRYPTIEWNPENRYLLSKYPIMAKALAGQETGALTLKGLDGQKRIFAVVPVPSTGWAVAASRVERQVMEPIFLNLIQQATLLLFVIAGSFVGALILSHSVADPIAKLRDEVKAFSRGEQPGELKIRGSTELDELGHSFYAMAKEIRLREEYLDRLRRQNELILNSAGEGIFGLDTKGAHTFVNPAAAKMLGYEVQELIGKGSHLTWHHTKANGTPHYEHDCPICAAFKDGTVHRVAEDVFWTKSGECFPVEYTSTPVIEDGKITGAVVTFRDITERKQVQNALEESRREYRELYDSAPDIYLTVTPEGIIRSINQSGADYLGYAKNELLGESCYRVLLDEDLARVKAHVRKVFAERLLESELDFRVVRKNGLVLWMYARSRLVLDDRGNPTEIRVICRDETERKKLEEALLRAQKLESVGLLAGGIAHDFNNLLTAILGSISLAKLSPKAPDDILETLNRAEQASLRATHLTNKLITFAKGGLPVTKVTSLNHLLEETAVFSLTGSDVRCEFTIPDDLWPVSVDENQMAQAFSNLIVNAEQAMPYGGVIRIAAQNALIDETSHLPLKHGKYVMISVQDKGTGIPEEFLDKIFDAYFTTKEKAQGLGLAITYSIVRKHNGHITVESKVGQGTTVHVYLPAAIKQSTETG